jgi:glucokinase
MFIAGIDLGGTNIKFGIFSKEGELLKSWKASSKPLLDPKVIPDYIFDELKRYEQWSEIKALGIGVPGLVSVDGIVKESPNFPDWKDVPVKQMLSEKFGIPVIVENDANLFTIGEGSFGNAKHCKNYVGITIGTGVGGGIVIDGNIVHGCKGMAGEIGHIVIHPSGPLCSCGKKGCLEAYSSATAIKKIMFHQTGLELEAEDVAKLALKGDKVALKVFEKVGYHLGIGIATIVNLLDVEVVVIGGGVSKSWDLLQKHIQKGFVEHTFKVHLDTVKIEKSLLGDNAGIFGGFFIATTVFNNSEVS